MPTRQRIACQPGLCCPSFRTKLQMALRQHYHPLSCLWFSGGDGHTELSAALENGQWGNWLGSVTPRSRMSRSFWPHMSHSHRAQSSGQGTSLILLLQYRRLLRTNSIHPGDFSGSWGLSCHELWTLLCPCFLSLVPSPLALPHGAPLTHA